MTEQQEPARAGATVGDGGEDHGAERDLRARVAELEALVATMADQHRALVARLDGGAAGVAAGVTDLATARAPAAADAAHEDGTRPAADERLGRRALLGSAGRVAAGALAGGAALALTQAGPAAAASGVFDGNPAVAGTNTGGAGGSAMYAVGATGNGLTALSIGGGNVAAIIASNDSTTAGRGLLARNSQAGNTTGVAAYISGYNGIGLHAITNSGSSAAPAAKVSNNSAAGGIGLLAENNGGYFASAISADGKLGTGVVALGGVGVQATAPTGWAVWATSNGTSKDGSSVALRGVAPSGIGVVGMSTTSIGGELSGGACDLRLGGLGVGSGGPSTRDHTAGHSRGDLAQDTATGDLWLCVVPGSAGQVGTWRKLAGSATTGALHALAVPKRVFDSRAGFAPLNSAKGAFVNQTKTIDAKNNASGVPAGATAALVNLAVTNTNSGGYGALWAQGASPGTANINWGVAATTTSNTVLTALKADGTFQCQIAGSADVVIDVIGYYL